MSRQFGISIHFSQMVTVLMTFFDPYRAYPWLLSQGAGAKEASKADELHEDVAPNELVSDTSILFLYEEWNSNNGDILLDDYST